MYLPGGSSPYNHSLRSRSGVELLGQVPGGAQGCGGDVVLSYGLVFFRVLLLTLFCRETEQKTPRPI